MDSHNRRSDRKIGLLPPRLFAADTDSLHKEKTNSLHHGTDLPEMADNFPRYLKVMYSAILVDKVTVMTGRMMSMPPDRNRPVRCWQEKC